MRELIKKILNIMNAKYVEVSKKENENKKSSIDSEYNKGIGTIYKGSIKESNRMLRFKERFKKYFEVAPIGVKEKGVEVK